MIATFYDREIVPKMGEPRTELWISVEVDPETTSTRKATDDDKVTYGGAYGRYERAKAEAADEAKKAKKAAKAKADKAKKAKK